ncbi:MAG: hypothetical protein KKF44_06500 [Nanoarchaeota archaeon]|nr:hypothetical protein [Nanoarchaeota archaeon]
MKKLYLALIVFFYCVVSCSTDGATQDAASTISSGTQYDEGTIAEAGQSDITKKQDYRNVEAESLSHDNVIEHKVLIVAYEPLVEMEVCEQVRENIIASTNYLVQTIEKDCRINERQDEEMIDLSTCFPHMEDTFPWIEAIFLGAPQVSSSELKNKLTGIQESLHSFMKKCIVASEDKCSITKCFGQLGSPYRISNELIYDLKEAASYKNDMSLNIRTFGIDKLTNEVTEIKGLIPHKTRDLRSHINDFPPTSLYTGDSLNIDNLAWCIANNAFFRDGIVFSVFKKNRCSENAIDYESLIDEFDICNKIADNEYDEVWLWGGSWYGYFESIMVGSNIDNTYVINAWKYIMRPDCVRPFIIMGFNYDVTSDYALHSFGHRAENILDNFLLSEGGQKYWNMFREFRRSYDDQNLIYHMGDIHYPPNPRNEKLSYKTIDDDQTPFMGDEVIIYSDSMPQQQLIKDGDYAFGVENRYGYINEPDAIVSSMHNAWIDYSIFNKDIQNAMRLGYPINDIIKEKLKNKVHKIDCNEWGCSQRTFLKWWFAHLPSSKGYNPFIDASMNWWDYIFFKEEDKELYEYTVQKSSISSWNIESASSFDRCDSSDYFIDFVSGIQIVKTMLLPGLKTCDPDTNRIASIATLCSNSIDTHGWDATVDLENNLEKLNGQGKVDIEAYEQYGFQGCIDLDRDRLVPVDYYFCKDHGDNKKLFIMKDISHKASCDYTGEILYNDANSFGECASNKKDLSIFSDGINIVEVKQKDLDTFSGFIESILVLQSNADEGSFMKKICDPITGYDIAFDEFKNLCASFEPWTIDSVCVNTDSTDYSQGKPFVCNYLDIEGIMQELIVVYVFSDEESKYLGWKCDGVAPIPKDTVEDFYRNGLCAEFIGSDGINEVAITKEGKICDPFNGPVEPEKLCQPTAIKIPTCLGPGYKFQGFKGICKFIPSNSQISHLYTDGSITIEFYETISEQYLDNLNWLCDTDDQYGRPKNLDDWFIQYGCREGIDYIYSDDYGKYFALVDESGMMCCLKGSSDVDNHIPHESCLTEPLSYFGADCIDGIPMWSFYEKVMDRDIPSFEGHSTTTTVTVAAKIFNNWEAEDFFFCENDRLKTFKQFEVMNNNCQEEADFLLLCDSNEEDCIAIAMVDDEDMICNPFTGDPVNVYEFCDLDKDAFLVESGYEINTLNNMQGIFIRRCQLSDYPIGTADGRLPIFKKLPKIDGSTLGPTLHFNDVV